MHELSIAMALVARIEEARKEAGADRVARATVRLGAWSGVQAEALAMAFPFAAENTGTAGARLDIVSVPVKLHCRACRGDTEPDTILAVCGSCGSDDVEMVAGRDLILETVTLE